MLNINITQAEKVVRQFFNTCNSSFQNPIPTPPKECGLLKPAKQLENCVRGKRKTENPTKQDKVESESTQKMLSLSPTLLAMLLESQSSPS